MTHVELVNYCLAAHLGLIAVFIAPFIKWGFYDEVLRKRLPPINRTIQAVAKAVGDDLSANLKSTLERSSILGELELIDDLAVYVERLADVWNSETFRQCVQDFVGKSFACFVDLRSLVSVKRRIRVWTTIRSILLIAFFPAELLLVVRLGIDKFGKGLLDDTVILQLFYPTGVFLLLLLLTSAVLMKTGGSAAFYEDKYNVK